MLVEEMATTLSNSRGPDRPLLELTIGGLLERTANRFPDRLAVVSRHQSKRMTWAELSAAAEAKPPWHARTVAVPVGTKGAVGPRLFVQPHAQRKTNQHR